MQRMAGLVGKPNTGKSTFFSAATLNPVKIAPFPFTTIEANKGVAYVRVKCVCREFNVEDNPKNSICIRGNRMIPVEIVDVAGLVPEAWRGRGLGNKFLDELRRADVLIHVVDASGSTDIEGRRTPPGTHDPCKDIEFLEKEIAMWIKQIMLRDWRRTVRQAEHVGGDEINTLYERLSGLKIRREDVVKALNETGLKGKKLSNWREEDIEAFSRKIREISKPMIIAANKVDISTARENIEKMKEKYGEKYRIMPCSAEAELVLRRAAERGLVEYIPGDGEFKVINEGKLTEQQRRALKIIQEKVLDIWGNTGVQQIINEAFLKLLKMIVVFPVEDINRLSDHHGNVLPDALLIREGTTARELAYMIHQELGETFICAVDARTKMRYGENYRLKMNDVIKIISAKSR